MLLRIAARLGLNHAALGWICVTVLGAAWTPDLGAAPRVPSASQQSRLDAAVAHHRAGRLEQARRELQALAGESVPAAQYNLAVMHLHAEVPQPSAAVAERLLERAARGGFVTAMFMLGQVLESGELGRRDLQAAHDWYEKAALAGSVQAQVAMGTAFYLGRGRPHDEAQAARWFLAAARGGDVGAQYLLASMYESGAGVAQDLRLARYWYEAAANNGDEAAPGKLKEIEARLAATPG